MCYDITANIVSNSLKCRIDIIFISVGKYILMTYLYLTRNLIQKRYFKGLPPSPYYLDRYEHNDKVKFMPLQDKILGNQQVIMKELSMINERLKKLESNQIELLNKSVRNPSRIK
jgi:hypothetical protein